MKDNKLKCLHESTVRIENVPLTIAFGADRNDDLVKAVQSGAFDSLPPIRVEIIACQLIDQLTKSWLA